MDFDQSTGHAGCDKPSRRTARETPQVSWGKSTRRLTEAGDSTAASVDGELLEHRRRKFVRVMRHEREAIVRMLWQLDVDGFDEFPIHSVG
jgi:hypothetical protein